MTSLKLMFAVGFVVGAGALAWAADAGARVRIKRASASLKREVAAFVKFIGEDVNDAPAVHGESEFQERSSTGPYSLGRWV
jgi:hypothetical protein